MRRLALFPAVLLLITIAISAAQRPAVAAASLSGEGVVINNGVRILGPTGTCNSPGTATFTFEAVGFATGPYPGLFTESGSFTITNGTQITAFSATFDITDANFVLLASGTKSLAFAQPATCTPATPSLININLIQVTYQATLFPSQTSDSGTGFVLLSGFSGATDGEMTETFTSTVPTPTNTPAPPTNTPTDTPTNTPVPPTNTPTDTPTNTPFVPTNTPTDTPTNTPVPPTNTPTDTPTNTPVPPTNTPTNTPTPVPLTIRGFFQPVDNPPVVNIAKAGSTIPLKFEVFAGATELTNTSVVTGIAAATTTCGGGGTATDAIEVVATGGTSLRYDSTAGQFVYNWKSPKSAAGTCVTVTVTFANGSELTALFQLT
jgi:hypothetical protein